MEITAARLDEFVARSDALGGPGNPDCDRWWGECRYRPEVVIDQDLDPFGEAYVAQQLILYGEISGRAFDQPANEHTILDVDVHVSAINPYDHGLPGGLAAHVERLSRALRLTNPPRPGRLLDMGCGWGLSSEVAAYTGLKVDAVDINADFVSLVNRRAARFGWDIEAVQGSFDSFSSDRRFDMVLFYECFHHALRPWALAERMARLLLPGGKLTLAGEPINDLWWRHWGMRLDPLSVYCIRKFGWLESGWSQPFLAESLRRAGLSPQFIPHPEPEIGWIVVAERIGLGHVGAQDIARAWAPVGWLLEQDHLTFLGDGSLSIVFPAEAQAVALQFRNYRPRPIRLRIRQGDAVLFDRPVEPGAALVELDRSAGGEPLAITADRWVPEEEIGNGDARPISIHLLGATFV